MPEIFRVRGFRFFFYSNEGNPREPIHVHIEKDGCEAKLYLAPYIHLAYNDGFDARTLAELIKIVDDQRIRIERAWNAFFG